MSEQQIEPKRKLVVIPFSQIHWTPNEKRVLDMLSKGIPVNRHFLIKALDNPTAKLHHLQVTISRIRPKLQMAGQDIVCRFMKGGYFYQHIIRLRPEIPHDESVV